MNNKNVIYEAYRQKNKSPFLIGITGAPAAGKTTFSLELKAWLIQRDASLTVTVISTDNFIYPNRYLIEHQLMSKKGFPESFDGKKFKDFLGSLSQASFKEIKVPFYSHDLKDIDPQKETLIVKSDIYILEGVHALFKHADFIARDFLDYCIYLDTDLAIVKERAMKRFLSAYEKAKIEPNAYFKPLMHYSFEEVCAYAENLWLTVDVPLIQEHVECHKKDADLMVSLYFHI